MADQMNRKRFQSREEYVEYRKARRRRKSIQKIYSEEDFKKPVINPYERNIREKLDRYVGKITVLIRQGKMVEQKTQFIHDAADAKLLTISYR